MRVCRISSLFLFGVVLVAGCTDGTTDSKGNASVESSLTSGPDLVISMVSDPPATAVAGGAFAIMDTVQNTGDADAGASFNKYYLSSNGTSLQLLLGNRAVGAIAAGGSDSGTAMLTIPAGAGGTYFVVACADSGPGTGGRMSQIPETNENNNCKASTGTVVVTAPDLTESNVSTSPADIDALSGTLTVTDTVNNGGTADAAASVTRWFLSADQVMDSSDAYIRNCTNGGPIPGRAVGPIVAGGSDAGSASTTPLCVRDASGLHSPSVGTYYVIACADNTSLVTESNEKNNCTASANPIVVTLCGNGIIEPGETCDDGNRVSGDGCNSSCQIEGNADLIASMVSAPPSTASIGGTIMVTDSITNVSMNGAPASTTYYYLSSDQIQNSNDRLLTGSRPVPALNAGVTNSGSATVTIPSGIPAGNWYLLACADGPNAVTESNETNNCIASSTTVAISGPDLVVSSVTDPPATSSVGTSFNITDTTANMGAGDAPASFTKLYLSPDGTYLQYYLATRSVTALAAGGTDAGTSSVTVPTGVTAGTYKIVACADAGPGTSGRTSQVQETNENNNCTASSGTIMIGSPDLLITSISDPPATGTIGTSFTITDTTANMGTSDTGAFFNKYYLSVDGVYARYYLGTGAAAPLAAGSNEQVTTTGVIPPKTAAGTYFLFGCADAGPGNAGKTSQIPESNEKNNCRASAMKITVN